jgi:hypothetical protein
LPLADYAFAERHATPRRRRQMLSFSLFSPIALSLPPPPRLIRHAVIAFADTPFRHFRFATLIFILLMLSSSG